MSKNIRPPSKSQDIAIRTRKAALLSLDEDVEVRFAAQRYGVSSASVSQARTRIKRERAAAHGVRV